MPPVLLLLLARSAWNRKRWTRHRHSSGSARTFPASHPLQPRLIVRCGRQELRVHQPCSEAPILITAPGSASSSHPHRTRRHSLFPEQRCLQPQSHPQLQPQRRAALAVVARHVLIAAVQQECRRLRGHPTGRHLLVSRQHMPRVLRLRPSRGSTPLPSSRKLTALVAASAYASARTLYRALLQAAAAVGVVMTEVGGGLQVAGAEGIVMSNRVSITCGRYSRTPESSCMSRLSRSPRRWVYLTWMTPTWIPPEVPVAVAVVGRHTLREMTAQGGICR